MSCHTSRESCSLIAAISNKTFRADNYGLCYMLGGAYEWTRWTMAEDYHDDVYQFMEVLVIKTCVTVANPV